MPSSSLETAVQRLDDSLNAWRHSRVDGQHCWIGPEETPLSQVAVRWPLGYQDEADEESGYAHLAEHALFRGAPGRDERENRLLAAGGLSNGRTNSRATMFWSCAIGERRELALRNEELRYAEDVDFSWIVHQAEVVRLELLHKANGVTEGYARILHAVETGPETLRGADGFGRDALSSGLAGFRSFVERGYRGRPAVALSGYPLTEVMARLESQPFANLRVRITGSGELSAAPHVADGAESAGSASLSAIPERLGIVDRALLGEAARLLLPDSAEAQVRLHLWGDVVTETTTPPFILMTEHEHGAETRVRSRFAALDTSLIARVVDEACAPAAARIGRLAAQLAGPWAAQTWSALLERTDDQGFAAPAPTAGTAERAVRRARRLLGQAVEAELAA